ncbi:D-lyxose/D-mannose family sugar isomerase [Bacteroidota bacterium]
MKRSQINHIIEESKVYFNRMNFKLPPWAFWTPEDWKVRKTECTEIIENKLGWDLTDFGSGIYNQTGLLLFTIRNGNPSRDKKSYAEKIMIVEENQVTPMHFHWSKMEDIINRGGGILCIELYPSDENEEFAKHPFEVSIDGIRKTMNPGDTVYLEPGESITLYQGLYHCFYGKEGHGKVLVGEVSAGNDDNADNRFKEEVGRFPEIIEDTAPTHLLVGDYTNLL